MRHPKLTIRELTQRAVDAKILDPDRVPSDTTVWRAIKKLNLDFSKASYVDPKGVKQYEAEHKMNNADGEEEGKNQGNSPAIPGLATTFQMPFENFFNEFFQCFF